MEENSGAMAWREIEAAKITPKRDCASPQAETMTARHCNNDGMTE
jgi:hypothetical protein